MDSSDTRFLAIENVSETRFKLLHGALVMDADAGALSFWGTPGIEHLALGTGHQFDLTGGVGGADRAYLSGVSADYRVTVSANTNVMTLAHVSAGTQVRLNVSRAPAVLVFEDGALGLEALWLGASQSVALLGVLGATNLIGESTVADHAVVLPQPAMGLLPEGALLQVVGRKGVETLYVSEAMPAVFLDGARADYRAHLQGSHDEVLSIGRRCQGLWEVVYVMDPAQLHFCDGVIKASALHRALLSDAAWPPASGPKLPDVPRISAITLDCNAAPHAQAPIDSSTWHPGQMLEISVFLSQAVLVTGAPKLQLRVWGHSRMAIYSGGSGSSTLRFTYRLSAYDVAQLQGCDVSAGQALADSYSNIEAGPLWPCGALVVPLVAPVRLRSDGSIRSAADRSTWATELDIDLNELDGSHGLDIDLGGLEREVAQPFVMPPRELNP